MKLRLLLKSILYKKPAKGIVLMYHRIADAKIDPWDLAVSPFNFEEHLKILQKYKVEAVNELGKRISDGALKFNSLAITFDDGYKDNFTKAKPLLEKYNCPATFFITSNYINSAKEYWWDCLQRICFESGILPTELKLLFPEEHLFKIGNLEDQISPQVLYLKLCDIIKKMPNIEQQPLINYLEDWAKNEDQRSEYLTMNKDELLDLAACKLFNIGAHTKTHPFLPNFSFQYQEDEIITSVKELSSLINKEIEYFAYPHGGCNEDSLNILAKSTIKLAFTTEPKGFTKYTNRLTVPRFQVNNWDGKTFETQLNVWLNNSE